MAMDASGNLYGTTEYGGSGTACVGTCGTVFEVTPAGTETVVYSFQGGSDGTGPASGLIADGQGNLYGTTAGGGNQNCNVGCGTVFEISNGTEKTLYSFEGGVDGWGPTGSLLFDAFGNLYGTTELGGPDNYGTAFRLRPDGTETVLYAFSGGADGYSPLAGVIMDSAGNLYGTTQFGGSNVKCKYAGGCGTVFKISPKGRKTMLFAMGNARYPIGGLFAGPGRLLYGTATRGGAHHDGVVFQVKK